MAYRRIRRPIGSLEVFAIVSSEGRDYRFNFFGAVEGRLLGADLSSCSQDKSILPTPQRLGTSCGGCLPCNALYSLLPPQTQVSKTILSSVKSAEVNRRLHPRPASWQLLGPEATDAQSIEEESPHSARVRLSAVRVGDALEN